MLLTITHDYTPAATGMAALLHEMAPDDVPVTARVHIVSAVLPYTAGQHRTLAALNAHQADACIVLESLPAHRHRACLRVCRNNMYVIDARRPLADLRHLAADIVSRLALPAAARTHWRDEVYHRLPHQPGSALKRAALSREECLTLRYLLAGWCMAALARRIGRSVKTVAGYKSEMKRRLNAFTPAGLHMRLCMEHALMQSGIRALYTVSPAGERAERSRAFRRRRLHLRERLQRHMSEQSE